jgi:hypothetical protein
MPNFRRQLVFPTTGLVCSQKLGYWKFDPILQEIKAPFLPSKRYVRRDLGPGPLIFDFDPYPWDSGILRCGDVDLWTSQFGGHI